MGEMSTCDSSGSVALHPECSRRGAICRGLVEDAELNSLLYVSSGSISACGGIVSRQGVEWRIPRSAIYLYNSSFE